MTDDYEENLSFGDRLELILLEPYNGKNIGDVIEVYRGVYNSLIDLKKALPINCWEDNDNLTNQQRLVINAKNLEKENKNLMEDNSKLYSEIAELKIKIESLKSPAKNKHLSYDNKMIETWYKKK